MAVGSDEWKQYTKWHECFEALCNRLGHADNARLASHYCAQIGRTDQETFEAVLKNLRNWRQGRHLPLRRNVIVLAQLLGVEDDPILQSRWNDLYAAARSQSSGVQDGAGNGHTTAVAEHEAPHFVNAHLARSRPWYWAAGGLTALVSTAAVFLHLWYGRLDPGLPLIGYDALVEMRVGESRVIHGGYGDCRGPVPDFYYFLGMIPHTSLGQFSDGGLARKMQNDCGRVILVRAINFTATSPGSDEVTLLDDYIKIVIHPVETN